MNRKYILLKDETVEISDGDREITLFRIQALRDINNDVKCGDKGGFIEYDYNLATEADDESWIYDYAMVFGHARVQQCSHVYDNARISGNALVTDFSYIRDNAKVYENAVINDSSIIHNAQIYGNACVSGYSGVSGNAKIYDRAFVTGDSAITHSSEISGNAYLDGACIHDNVRVYGNAHVEMSTLSDNVKVYGNAFIFGVEAHDSVQIFGNTDIQAFCELKGKVAISGNARINNDSSTLFNGNHDDAIGYNYSKIGISGEVSITGNAEISGSVWISGNVKISGNTKISALIITIKDNSYCFTSSEDSSIIKISGNVSIDGNTEIKLWKFSTGESPLDLSKDERIFIAGKTEISGNTVITEPVTITDAQIAEYKRSTDSTHELEEYLAKEMKLL